MQISISENLCLAEFIESVKKLNTTCTKHLKKNKKIIAKNDSL